MSLLLALTGGGGTPSLTGQSVVAGKGTVGVTVTVALTGVGTAVSQGTVAPAVIQSLSGQSVVAARGTLLPQTSPALTGQAVVVGQGSVTVSGGSDVTVALTGVSVTVDQGSVTPSAPVNTGQSGIRRWLIEYYTAESEKALTKKKSESVVTTILNKIRKPKKVELESDNALPVYDIDDNIRKLVRDAEKATARTQALLDKMSQSQQLANEGVKLSNFATTFSDDYQRRVSDTRDQDDEDLILMALIS